MVVKINGWEFKVLRNTKKAREYLDIYKNRPAKESYPQDVLDTSEYCILGEWHHNHEFVLEWHDKLEKAISDLKAKRARMICWNEVAYAIGVTVDYEEHKYLAILNFGLQVICGDNLLIKIA